MSTLEQNTAFAAALDELFRQYPMNFKTKSVMKKNERDRCYALDYALRSGDLFLARMFAAHVPSKEIEAVHALIYG